MFDPDAFSTDFDSGSEPQPEPELIPQPRRILKRIGRIGRFRIVRHGKRRF